MKKLFFFAAVAVMAITACSKTEFVNEAQDNLITFQAAKYLTQTKAVTGTEFPKTETFGTYAWTAGTPGEFFMNNIEIKFDATNNKWAPVTSYFWPKNQTVDFFSYYPYDVQGAVPQVSATAITYNDVDFTANQVDIMYADKAVKFFDNSDDVNDGTSLSLVGVPTYFRHAGAKVTINVILSYDFKAENGDTTKWNVTMKEAYLDSVFTKGSVTLTLSDQNATGLVPWTKPLNADDQAVWTPTAGSYNSLTSELYKISQNYVLKTNEGVKILDEVYMLPQALEAGLQKLKFKFDVETLRKAAGETTYSSILTQTDLIAETDLLIPTVTGVTGIYAWEMNKAITYNVYIGPASKPIYFDPAISAWETQEATTSVELDL
ncbi:MAG: fimbrillin family protein [Bacteroidales bacterium]|nr:fimbrillin family protein [Bacteroidales bacterium]